MAKSNFKIAPYLSYIIQILFDAVLTNVCWVSINVKIGKQLS